LYKAGLNPANTIAKSDSVIFEILAKASREQCALISNHFERKCKVSLVNAVLAKYKGNIGRALILWISPIPVAIAKRFQLILHPAKVDCLQLCNLIAKYDRPLLSAVCACYREMFDQNLIDLVDLRLKSSSTNLRTSVRYWLCNDSYDRGEEQTIESMISSYRADNALVLDSALVEELIAAIDREKKLIVAYASHHNVHVPSPKKPVKVSSASKSQKKQYHQDCKLMMAFLKERFAEEDVDNSGYLDPTEFWSTLKNLHLGYTDMEIEDIHQWIDCDGDGTISLDEVVPELARNIVTTIHERANGLTVQQKVEQLRTEYNANRKSLQDQYNSHRLATGIVSPALTAALSPDLISYLKDTFDENDVDQSGKLDPEEFWAILAAVLRLDDNDKCTLEVFSVSYFYLLWHLTLFNFCSYHGMTTTMDLSHGPRL
jgi:Ca2+-binding EF-hand superfamily protein